MAKYGGLKDLMVKNVQTKDLAARFYAASDAMPAS
jgi:hypothetical protein